MMPTLNAWLLFGAQAAASLGETGDERRGAAGPRRRQSTLQYADTERCRYVVVGSQTMTSVRIRHGGEPIAQPGAGRPTGLRPRPVLRSGWSAARNPPCIRRDGEKLH